MRLEFGWPDHSNAWYLVVAVGGAAGVAAARALLSKRWGHLVPDIFIAVAVAFIVVDLVAFALISSAEGWARSDVEYREYWPLRYWLVALMGAISALLWYASRTADNSSDDPDNPDRAAYVTLGPIVA